MFHTIMQSDEYIDRVGIPGRKWRMLQSRFRSKVAWTSLLALALFVAKTYFGYEIAEADRLVDLILLSASALGIFNNPSDAENF